MRPEGNAKPSGEPPNPQREHPASSRHTRLWAPLALAFLGVANRSMSWMVMVISFRVPSGSRFRLGIRVKTFGGNPAVSGIPFTCPERAGELPAPSR